MARAATSVPKESAPSTLEKLREFLETARMKEKLGPHAFAEFEKELHARMMEAERDIVAAEMARLDVDADAVVIDGRVHRRVLRQSQTYMTSAGEVVVERTLYKDRKDEDGRCVSPMELALGIVGDFWAPRAAQQALWVATQMTPKKGAELFERVGNMAPSKSSLDRLPKIIASNGRAIAKRSRPHSERGSKSRRAPSRSPSRSTVSSPRSMAQTARPRCAREPRKRGA